MGLSLSASKKNNLPKWFKILLGLAFMGVLLGFFGVLFTEDLQDVVEGQLGKLREDRLTQAYYDYTASDFQETTSLESFREFIAMYPALSNNKKFILEEKVVENDKGYLQGILISNEFHEMKVDYQLLKENRRWKILSIRLKESLREGEDESATLELIEKVDAQLKALRRDDITDAYYSFVSRDFQKETPLKFFREFVRANSILTSYRGVNFKNRRIENDVGYVDVILSSNTSDYILEYKLSREGSDWKIWSLRVVLPPEEAAKKAATDPEALVPPVRELLEALHDKNIQEAYEGTASEFQEATPYQSFEEFINIYPVITKRDLADIKSGSIENGVGKLRTNLHDQEGITVIEFNLGFEEGQWKIWGMQIIEQPEADPDKSMAPVEEGKDDHSLAEELFPLIESQLIAFRYQDIRRAYHDYTSKGYKDDHTLSEFEDYVAEHQELSQARALDFNPLSYQDNTPIMQGTLSSFEDSQYLVKYEFTQEDGLWKIHSFQSRPQEGSITGSDSPMKIHEQNPQQLNFSGIVIGTKVDQNGLVQDSTVVIDSDVNLIFFNVYVENGVKNTLITLFLEHFDSLSSAPPLSTSLLEDGNSIVTFSFAAPTPGWPVGDYIVKITSSSGQEYAEIFEIGRNTDNK